MNSLINAISNLSIRNRLIGGFSSIVLILIVIVWYSISSISTVGEISKRVVDLRVPTSAASSGLVTNIHASLASLRGWMLTHNEVFSKERKVVWDEIGEISDDMNLLSATWTVQANKDKWENFKTILAEFKVAQQLVEDEADLQTSIELLVKEAAPRAGKLLTILAGEKNSDGTRTGGMVANQKKLLVDDGDIVNDLISELKTMEIAALLIALAVSAGLGFFTVRAIVTPINSMVGAMGDLAAGDYDTEVPAQDRKDEIGSMATAVQVFKEAGIENIRMTKEVEEQRVADEKRERDEREATEAHKQRELAEERQETEAREKKAQAMADLVNGFNTEVSEVIKAVTAGTTELDSTAQAMSATAEESGVQATNVAAAAEQASVNVQTVASATEEMGATVSEIGNQMEKSNIATQEVSSKSKATTVIMDDLSVSSQSISDIVNLINDIAEQTNLLALNATIEAARAGDAGRGFAVVASEVKNLAGQTANATNQISTQVQDIQDKIKDATAAMTEITSSVEITAELASSVAAAIEEQQVTTIEISRNVQEAARGTQEVSDNIGGVALGAGETAASSSQVMATAQEMAQQTNMLKSTIDNFLSGVESVNAS